jgi:hypothetical protein
VIQRRDWKDAGNKAMGWACNTHKKDEKYKFRGKNQKEEAALEI